VKDILKKTARAMLFSSAIMLVIALINNFSVVGGHTSPFYYILTLVIALLGGYFMYLAKKI
jgi:hypothetical protein